MSHCNALVSPWSLKIHFINYPGVVSLVTKTFFLVVAIILANFGFQKDRPFLLHCVDENSTLLNDLNDAIPCTNLTSCFSEFSEPSKENFTELSAVLQHLELANSSLEQFEKNGNPTKRALKKIELMREKVKEAQLLAEEVEEEMLNPKGLRQKIRICGDEETTIRLVTLSSLVSLLVLAALATYQLHKITDYKVGSCLNNRFASRHSSNFQTRSSSTLPKRLLDAWRTAS